MCPVLLRKALSDQRPSTKVTNKTVTNRTATAKGVTPNRIHETGKKRVAQKSLSPVRHTGKSDTPPESLRRFPTPWNKPLRGKKKSTLRRPCALICIDPPQSEDKSVIKLDRTHPAIQFWEQENKSEASPVRDTFMSLLQSYRKCPQCSTEKLCYSVVWNLGVPIPQGHFVCDTPNFHSGRTRFNDHTRPPRWAPPTPTLQSALEQGTRYGGSPTVTGQIGNGSKANILYDGSTSQSGPNPLNTWPKNKNFVLFDDSNAPPSVATSSSSTNCTSSAVVTTAYSLAPNRLQTPPIGSPPPPYSYTATARRSVPAVSLNDCLDAFMLTEVLDGADRPMCANCGKKTACELHHSITRLPDILIIHLLRFCCGDLRQKIDVPVDFPNMINMTEYTQSEYERRHKFTSSNQNANDHIYWLYAVVYHDGSMSYGHYTTACRTTTGADPSSDQWHHFDDEFVKEMRPEEVHKSSAYLLFYERDSLYQQRKSTQVRPVNGIRCIDTRQPRAQAHTFETRSALFQHVTIPRRHTNPHTHTTLNSTSPSLPLPPPLHGITVKQDYLSPPRLSVKHKVSGFLYRPTNPPRRPRINSSRYGPL
ncbi:hypothetical protein FGIG_10055 [Fasciola gigantica]|uniref:ubiquitinyl hydrolase 1 n=1 Tax=Fasciola gigantica TaxID=46835 RepID=A0A504YV09_FASGI|nr:hypothetical protein FGIG_10055 [Fasciola gigantica]